MKKSKVASTEAQREGGSICNSVEAFVMDVERRNRVVLVDALVNSLGRMSQ